MRRALFLIIATACSSHDPTPASPAVGARKAELAGQGMMAYEKQDWAGCAALLDQTDEHYNAACCHARAGQADAAFGKLDRAIADGFDQVEHVKVDSDLDTLHADPRWQAMLAELDRKTAARRARQNQELSRLYAEDQADRAGGFASIDWSKVTPRDHAREKRIDEIVASGKARVADDWFHAAMVHQHGDGLESIRKAHSYALAASAIDPAFKSARWLAAASEDRLLVRQGKKQRWGTQYSKKGDGVPWKLDDYEPATTDEERAVWNVPPIAESLERAKHM